MNIRKIAAVGLAAIAAGATAGLATAQLSGYVTHTDGTLTSPMVVIGSQAGDAVNYPKDVVAAADLAAHVAGYATTPVVTTGSAKSFGLTGEGQEVATGNTKIFLDNTLGKSGLRSTMTNTDLPTLLATGTVIDRNSTSIKYDQFLFLTPGDTSNGGGNEKFFLQFERPSSSSSDDGTYSFGRLSTSPDHRTTYFVNYRMNFRKGAQAKALTGKTLTIAGETYTVLSDSVSETGVPKLVTTKASASQSILVSDGPVTVTVGGNAYEVQIIGTSDANTVVVSVNGVSKSATKEATTNINGVDVYVDDVFHFANNQDSSGATLLIGAEKVIFQNASKIKVGTNEENIDGTYVVFTTSSGKFDTMNIYLGAPESSVTDVLKMGGSYTLPGLPKLALYFPGVSEDLMAATRNVLTISPSGDNQVQMGWTDDSGNAGTITWAYKSLSTDSAFRLADSSGNSIRTLENTAVAQDEYVIFDAGDFPHFMRVSSLGSDSLSFTLLDVFSGESTRYDLASSDLGQKTIYIDGQAYYAKFDGVANTSINFTWGDGAAFGSHGDARTVWPTLKGLRGERLALLNGTNVSFYNNTGEIQLPTGAVTVTSNVGGANDVNITLTAVTDEDGESSACTTSPCVSEFSIVGAGTSNFTLGKTSTGGVNYAIMSGADNYSFKIGVMGRSTTATAITQPSLLLFEEKDDSSNRYSVIVSASSTASSGNNLADAGTPVFTAVVDTQTRGSDSNIVDHVDLYGVFAVEDKNDQNSVTIYYPDEQIYAVIGAGEAEKTASVGGSTGSTVDAAVVITSPVAKLANEVNTATLASDLILVGGPCANTLVAQLAADNDTGIPACSAWTLTTGLIKEVDNAFSSGRKALVVAGTTADDTRSLAAQVMQGTLSFEV